MENSLKKVLLALILVLLAVVSFFLAADQAESYEAHSATIASINDKVEDVLKLTATSTLASAGISAIPGDTATPIAEKLADFTEYFLLILCVLYAEKYLLTIIGAATFKVLIPGACVLLIISMFYNPKVMRSLAMKFAIFGISIFLMIPLSLRVSDMIYANYKISIDNTITEAEEFTDQTVELSDAEDEGVIASILDRLSETAASLSDKAARILNNFVESLAVMIVTSCIIPILVLLFFIWLVKMLTGAEISPPRPRSREHGKAA